MTTSSPSKNWLILAKGWRTGFYRQLESKRQDEMRTVMPAADLWSALFQMYNARYWHVVSHRCSSDMCPEAPPRSESTEAYAELARDIEVVAIEGFRHAGVLSKGSTVRIVMVSRFGDLGITPHLNHVHGYLARVPPTEEFLVNCRLRQ